MANEKRLIDANALIDEMNEETDKYYLFIDAFEYLLENAPTIDAVEVVRCKDCKHRYTMSSGHSFCRENFPLGKYDDDFCSYGERKDNDN